MERWIMASIITIVIILIILYVTYDKYALWRTKLVCIENGECFNVHTTHKGHKEAVHVLSKINKRVNKLISILEKKYTHPDSKRYKLIHRIKTRYNKHNIRENSPYEEGDDTSYTIDKGKITALCLREDDPTPDIHNINLLMFVVLHELTHMGLTESQHPPTFWEAFKFILTEAQMANLIINQNYALSPELYCGMEITSNPYFNSYINEYK